MVARTKKVAEVVAEAVVDEVVMPGGAVVKVVPTDEQMVADGLVSLSQRIRFLASMGLGCAEITKVVKRSNGEHPRYQHTRNVLLTPLKRPTPTPTATDGETAATE